MTRYSAAFLVLIVSAAAFGNSITLEPVPYVRPAQDLAYDIDAFEAEGWKTYDIVVHVNPGDSWTCAYAEICVGGRNGNVFWEHPAGDNVAPSNANLQYFGLLAYDSFWTSSEEYPNPDLAPGSQATTFAPGSPLQNTPASRTAEWYADPEAPNAGAGVYTIARITVHESTQLCVYGDAYFDGYDQPVYFGPLEPCQCGDACPGDLTFDNKVALDDLAVLLAHYGDTQAGWHYGDMDSDGDVDLNDLAAFLALYGSEC